jgi:hypothetical protein
MNEETKGGGAMLFPSGMYLGRIVEYIDLGNQPQEFQGQAKDPAPEFRMAVALYNVPGVPAGEPYILRPYGLTLSQNEKSGARKAFKTLNYTQNKQITHFAQFLNEPYVFYVHEVTSKATQKKSMQIAWDKTLPPYDPVSKQPYLVPQPADDLFRVFLWDFPTAEAWNSLYIEGQTDSGKSKNFIQETILAATNFEGSALHQLLIAAGQNIPAQQAAQPAAPAQPTLAVPQPAAAPAGVPVAMPQQAQQVAVPLAQPTALPVQPALPAVPGQIPATPAPAAVLNPGVMPLVPVPTPAGALPVQQ